MATHYKVTEIENGIEMRSYTFNSIDGVAYYGYSRSGRVKCKKDARVLSSYDVARNTLQGLKNQLEIFEMKIDQLEQEYLKRCE